MKQKINRHDEDRMLARKLLFASLLIVLAISWMLASAYVDYSCLSTDGWFPRSGAVLAISAILVGIRFRPVIEGAATPDFVDIFESTIEGRANRPAHWVAKFVTWIVYAELFSATAGTIVWAYGDWIISCKAA